MRAPWAKEHLLASMVEPMPRHHAAAPVEHVLPMAPETCEDMPKKVVRMDTSKPLLQADVWLNQKCGVAWLIEGWSVGAMGRGGVVPWVGTAQRMHLCAVGTRGTPGAGGAPPRREGAQRPHLLPRHDLRTLKLNACPKRMPRPPAAWHA